MAEEEEEEEEKPEFDPENFNFGGGGDDGEVAPSKGHNCKICIKQPRKNQLLLHCSKCFDTYFKSCPALTAREIKDYDNLFRTWLKAKETWDCPECRKKLPSMYCTLCHMDKDKILLECSWCKGRCHSDCAGNVKLGLSVSCTEWLCSKCKNSGNKRAGFNADDGEEDGEPKAIVGVKELEANLKKEFYPYEGFKLLHLNLSAQRLHKVKHFLLRNEKFVDVFAIGETNLNKSHPSDEYEVAGYEMIRSDKKVPLTTTASKTQPKASSFEAKGGGDGGKGGAAPAAHKDGGIIFYVRKDWKILSKSSDFFENAGAAAAAAGGGANPTGGGKKAANAAADSNAPHENIEYLEVRIEKENKRLKGDSLCLCLVLVYSPKPNNQIFLELLEQLLINRIGKLKHINQVFVMGDVKINLLANIPTPTRMGINLKSIMTELNYKLLLDEDEPTMATKKSAKLCHVLYASEDVEELGVKGGVVYLDWASHYLLYAVKKYYFNQMPTLEAKIFKALGFKNLSEHTTTKKERVINAILEYAKALKAKRELEEAAAAEAAAKAKQAQEQKTENGGMNNNGVEDGKGNGHLEGGSQENSANKNATTLSEPSSSGKGGKANGSSFKKILKKNDPQGSGGGQQAKAGGGLGRKKRFWLLPLWCSSVKEAL